MDYRFTYLLMGILFMLVWLVLFFLRKDNRKEMLIISALSAIAGPIADILYTQDWWNRPTLMGTNIGWESILVGFMIGGIASVLYEDVFKKKVKIRKKTKKEKTIKIYQLVLIIALISFIFFGSFYLLKLNSLWATILTCIIPTAIIWVHRGDLIVESFVTGVLLVLVASLVYSILNLLTPGWVQAFWYFKNVTDIMILNLPLDDLIWYFLAGVFIGPFYEFWQEGRLEEVK